MNDFLTKPVDVERLAKTLLRWGTRPAPEASPPSEARDDFSRPGGA